MLLLFQKKENNRISTQKSGKSSVIVIDLEKDEVKTNYFYVVSGCLLITVGITYLIKPHFANSDQEKINPLDNLTVRELTIVSLIEKGFSNKEIEQQLSISLSTVKTHVNNIFKKLNIKSRAELLKTIKLHRV